jgi:hypothetical protein
MGWWDGGGEGGGRVVGVRGTYVMAETGKARSRADASQGLEYRGEGQQGVEQHQDEGQRQRQRRAGGRR